MWPRSSQAGSAKDSSRFMRLFYLVTQNGKAEWWAYGSILAWLVFVPAAIWAIGQTSAAASALRASMTISQSVPKLHKTAITGSELGVVKRNILSNYPDFVVGYEINGILTVSVKTVQEYEDWVLAMSMIPTYSRNTVWTIKSLCVSSESTACNGGAIHVALLGESLSVMAPQ